MTSAAVLIHLDGMVATHDGCSFVFDFAWENGFVSAELLDAELDSPWCGDVLEHIGLEFERAYERAEQCAAWSHDVHAFWEIAASDHADQELEMAREHEMLESPRFSRGAVYRRALDSVENMRTEHLVWHESWREAADILVAEMDIDELNDHAQECVADWLASVLADGDAEVAKRFICAEIRAMAHLRGIHIAPAL